MKQRMVIWAIGVAFVSPPPASAQVTSLQAPVPATVTVEQLVALALDRAPSLQAQRSAIARARAEAEQAALRANPTLSTEQRQQLGGTDRMTAVNVEWPLELFRRAARVTVAQAQIAVATADVAEAERRLAGDVRRRAVELLAAERRAAVVDEVTSSLRDTYELLKRRVEEGATAPLSRDQAYVEWQRSEAQRPLRRADARTARAELSAVVGLAIDTSLVIGDDLTSLGHQPVPTSPEVRADIRQARATLASATAMAESAKQQGRMDVGVFGGYTHMNNSFPQLGIDTAGAPTQIQGAFNNLSLGVSLTLPLGNRNQGAVAAATADIKAAEWRQSAARLNADAELAAARARDDESRATVEIYDAGLRTTARKNLDVVRESFLLGRMTLADVFAEHRRLLDVEMGYVDALTVAASARMQLLFVSGVTR